MTGHAFTTWPAGAEAAPCERYGCGHPFAHHDMTDDEPGPCYSVAGCPCDAYQPETNPTDADLAAAGMLGEGGDRGREIHAAAWRQSQEAHR